MSDLLDAALSYAARGWHILPVQVGGKAPLSAHGVQDASADEGAIRAWWGRCPEANIGIAAAASGLVVVDVDAHGEADGWASWRELRAELGEDLERTICCETPTGGAHYYYSAVGPDLAPSVGRLGPGLDVRAGSSYVVAPPSRRPDGDYRWAMGASPDDLPLAPLPAGLAERLARSKTPVIRRADTARVPQGERNAALAALAGSLRRQGATEDELLAALRLANARRCDPPLDEAEVDRIAQSIARYAPAPAGQFLSDMGNARRFALAHGGRVRYCAALGGWLAWDGRRWALDETGLVWTWAKATALAILDEARDEPDDGRRQALARWAASSQSAARLEAMLRLAQSEPEIAAKAGEFDTDPWTLNTLSGLLDLRAGTLRPHSPAAMVTRLAPVPYDPEATSAALDRYLAHVVGGDLDLLAYIQRWAGYCLTGQTGEETFFLLLGPAATGKSSLVEALLALLGDYGLKASFDTFLERRDIGAPRPDLVAMRGARLVAAIETSAGKRLAEALIKEMVGGDTLTARALYSPFVSFVPQFKLLLSSNEAPKMSDRDSGLWRRLRHVPFPHVIPADERDPGVKTALRDPLDGGRALLAWALRGCLDWQRHGLGTCGVVEGATARLRGELDPLREFFASCCRFERGLEVDAAKLREAYANWVRASGGGDRDMVSNAEWGQRLREAGCEPVTRRQGGQRVRLWRGVEMLDAAEPVT